MHSQKNLLIDTLAGHSQDSNLWILSAELALYVSINHWHIKSVQWRLLSCSTCPIQNTWKWLNARILKNLMISCSWKWTGTYIFVTSVCASKLLYKTRNKLGATFLIWIQLIAIGVTCDRSMRPSIINIAKSLTRMLTSHNFHLLEPIMYGTWIMQVWK